MRRERREMAKPTVRGVLTALVVVFGMLAVVYVTVTLSGSQQTFVQQLAGSKTQSGTAASNSTVNETSPSLLDQTTSGQQGGASPPETVSVSIPPGSGNSDQVSYLPYQVTVVIGVNNTVTWVNNDSAPHTVTAKDGSFSSGNMGQGGVYTYTFTTPGTYRYYCIYHSWMVGVVVVEAG